MIQFLVAFDYWLWSGCLIFLLVGLGILLTLRLKAMPLRYFGYAMKLAFSRQSSSGEGDISQFQSLMTALAATIGIGSIAGVATAVMAGGMGAIFWMWIIALFGMATKYAEALLAVKYRALEADGQMSGGPMHYMAKGLGWKKAASLFALACILSSFAGGNLTQANSAAMAMKEWIGVPPVATGIVLALITAAVLFRGIRAIGKVCAYFIPFMALFYVAGGLAVLFLRIDQLLPTLLSILRCAWTGQAAVGGFMGASIFAALQMGAARGVCSNEAGLGSAPIASAAAKTEHPGTQALISMTGVFLSTFVCTITAFVIGSTGVMGQLSHDGTLLNGAALVMQAFSSTLPGGGSIVAIGLLLFGYSTIFGWAYYGEKSVEYLVGRRAIPLFRILFCIVVFLGAIASMNLVWPLVDIMNGLMALPNLIALFALSGVVADESRSYFSMLEGRRVPTV